MKVTFSGLAKRVFLMGEPLEQRRAICNSCEHMRESPIKHCAACGCPINSKTRIADAQCPKGKWPRS